jgi:putative ABC transport system substrate-binding protein
VAQIGAVGILAASGVDAQPRSRPQVGVVHPASVEDSAVYRILVPKLAELGYVDGKTIKLALRSGGGKPDALALSWTTWFGKVDVLLVVGPAAVAAAVAATRSVPIIAIDLESDPVGRGWMQSLSRPGGNLTGSFSISPVPVRNGCSSCTKWFPGRGR